MAGTQQHLIEHLQPNPWQPRKVINLDNLALLTEAIKKQGFVGYSIARRDPLHPDRLQLVFGHRRLKAAERAGLKTLPVVIKEYSDAEMAEIALLENRTQEAMSYFDEGRAFIAMIEEHGYTIRELAKVMGASLGYITNRIGIARLPEDSPIVAAAQSGQADMTALLALSYLTRDLTLDSIQELLDGAIKGEINAEQLKRLQVAVRSVDRDLDLVDDDGKLTVTLQQAKELGTRLKEERMAVEAANLQRYHTLLEAERGATPGDAVEPVNSRQDSALTSASARKPPVPAPATLAPVTGGAHGSAEAADTPPRNQQDWAVLVTERLHELRTLLSRQDPATAQQDMPPALWQEAQLVVKLLLHLLQPTRYRLKKLRRQSANG